MGLGGLFIVTLQLFGINLAGALVRIFEVSAEEPSLERGSRWLFPVGLAASVLVVGTLFAVHLGSAPELVRPSLAQRAAYQMGQAVDAGDVARTVQTSASFTRADPGQETLLGVAYAQRDEGVAGDSEVLERLEARVVRYLLGDADFTPLVKVELLDALE